MLYEEENEFLKSGTSYLELFLLIKIDLIKFDFID